MDYTIDANDAFLPNGNYSHLNQYGIASDNAKISINNNQIKIDTGTFKASEPCILADDWHINANHKRTLLNSFTKGIKGHLGLKKFSNTKYSAAFDTVFANLTHAAKYDRPVIYSRDATNGEITINVIDFLTVEGMIYNVIGTRNEYQGNASWMVPTSKFSVLVEQHKIKQMFDKGALFITVRERKDKKNPDKKRKEISRDLWEAGEYKVGLVNRAAFDHNSMWLDNDITLDGEYLNPYVFRAFVYSEELGGLDLGGRFYGRTKAPMNKPQEQRHRIKFNTIHNTIELDFDSLHPNMLYTMVGQQMDIAKPYELDGYDTPTAKNATLRLFNSLLSNWKRNVTISGIKKNIDEYNDWKKNGSGKIPFHLQGFIEGIKEGTKGEDVYKAIATLHAPIVHYFGNEDLGLKLQRMDSDIMSNILIACASQGILVYPIHDSVICQEPDEHQVREIMQRAYRKVMGKKYSIGISKKELID